MFIRSLFSSDLLVELSESKIVIQTFGKGPKVEYEPYLAVQTLGGKKLIKSVGSEAKSEVGEGIQVINPFSHPRSFVADFYVAEKLIQHGLRKIHKSRFIKPAPRLVIHQLDKAEGGLTNVEERVLIELAVSSGAREVVTYVGKKLNSDSVTFDDVKKTLAR